MSPLGDSSGPGVDRGRHAVVSPISGETIGEVHVASAFEIAGLLGHLPWDAPELRRDQVLEFLARFRQALERRHRELLATTILETGFTEMDSREMLDGAIEFLHDFEIHARDQETPRRIVPHSYRGVSSRQMQIMPRPYRCVAAVVPQNASLVLAITIIASALYAGTRVLLRPSLQCGLTGQLLAELVEESRPPGPAVHIVNSLASDFIAACQSSELVDLIHYIGSNEYALDVFVGTFRANKSCLLDGQGNGLLYVDEGFAVGEAAELIATAATRFNGETCTSVNGVLAHESLFPALRDAVADLLRSQRVGDPMDPATRIGPLFSRKQAELLDQRLRHGSNHLLCGGRLEGAYFAPALVEGVSLGDPLVREGCFGPALWIQPVREETVFDWLRANTFPLSDTVLSHREDVVRRVARCSRAARVCVNADPSTESLFEPWGGYPPSGLDPVSMWLEKYRQLYQLDGEPKHLRLAGV